MRLPALPLAVAASLGLCCCGQSSSVEEGACAADGQGCAGAAAEVPKAVERRHFWPNKGGNLNGSGQAAISVPLRLEQFSWAHRPSSIVHTSPVIDDEGNVYVSETSGRLVSLTKYGVVRWSYQSSGLNAGIPALHGDYLYGYCDTGYAFSLRLADGEARWARKVGLAAPSDAATAVVYGDIVIMPVNLNVAMTGGNCDFVALSLEDGTMRWSYSVCERSQKTSFNALPAVVNGMVIAHDCTGGMHAFSVEDGTPRWYVAGYAKDTMSTGASAVGPNNMAYAGFVREGFCDLGKGMVRAHDIFSGQVAWTRSFDKGVNAGVAVGYLGKGGPLAVVALVANNFMPPMTWWQTLIFESTWAPLSWKLWVMSFHRSEGRVIAMDAQTGATLWTVQLDTKMEWGYTGFERGCFPDAGGTPSIGADGTVYLNWSKGVSYALRDADGNGQINEWDPKEFSKLEHSLGCNGQTAIAPGMLVAPTCDAIFGWVDDAGKAKAE